MGSVIAVCGNDCAACPRYTLYPYEKTDEELHHTAELWMKIGYRDYIVTNEEIACSGCKPENWCRYRVIKCCVDRGIKNCGECDEYPCDNTKECFKVTKSFEPMCRQVCTDDEYKKLESVNAPEGIPSSTVRTVSENCRTLKITNFGFED